MKHITDWDSDSLHQVTSTAAARDYLHYFNPQYEEVKPAEDVEQVKEIKQVEGLSETFTLSDGTTITIYYATALNFHQYVYITDLSHRTFIFYGNSNDFHKITDYTDEKVIRTDVFDYLLNTVHNITHWREITMLDNGSYIPYLLDNYTSVVSTTDADNDQLLTYCDWTDVSVNTDIPILFIPNLYLLREISTTAILLSECQPRGYTPADRNFNPDLRNTDNYWLISLPTCGFFVPSIYNNNLTFTLLAKSSTEYGVSYQFDFTPYPGRFIADYTFNDTDAAPIENEQTFTIPVKSYLVNNTGNIYSNNTNLVYDWFLRLDYGKRRRYYCRAFGHSRGSSHLQRDPVTLITSYTYDIYLESTKEEPFTLNGYLADLSHFLVW